MCACVSVCVCQVEGVREEGTYSSQPPAALLLSLGNQTARSVLLPAGKRVQGHLGVFVSVFPLWILFSRAHIYAHWNS